MAMGKRQQSQQPLWVGSTELPRGPGHPFYERLNEVLAERDFDAFVEERCEKFYAERMGRPSLAPGRYFRMLLMGYFEGIDSERGIAWRVADSLGLREFLGLGLTQSPPDHSTLSRTRRLIDLDTHTEIFTWVVRVMTEAGLIRGKTVGIDATTLEANAALRSIVQRESGEGYDEFLSKLAKEAGIESPTRADLSKIDKKRPKKGSNKEWVHPGDPEAEITKMKNGQTHLAHKVEHAVDMETGAVMSVTIHGGARGDTKSLPETMEETRNVLADVAQVSEAAEQLSDEVLGEVVADKGYHSNDVLIDEQELGTRTYISEPDRGRRNWKGRASAKKAVYANRRRIRGRRGKALLRQRGEKLERSFAHCYETGGMRRLHLRGHENILKRLLIHVAGFNLGLLMRELCSVGKPRVLQGHSAPFSALFELLRHLWRRIFGPRSGLNSMSALTLG